MPSMSLAPLTALFVLLFISSTIAAPQDLGGYYLSLFGLDSAGYSKYTQYLATLSITTPAALESWISKYSDNAINNYAEASSAYYEFPFSAYSVFFTQLYPTSIFTNEAFTNPYVSYYSNFLATQTPTGGESAAATPTVTSPSESTGPSLVTSASVETSTESAALSSSAGTSSEKASSATSPSAGVSSVSTSKASTSGSSATESESSASQASSASGTASSNGVNSRLDTLSTIAFVAIGFIAVTLVY